VYDPATGTGGTGCDANVGHYTFSTALTFNGPITAPIQGP